MRLDKIAAVVTFAATIVLLVPFQGALDRLGPLARIPTPSASTSPAPAALTLLDAGLWWRTEPDYSFFLILHDAFARRSPAPLVSPMGPWGFLFRGWHPGTAGVLIAAWCVIAGGFWFAVWSYGRAQISNAWIASAWYAALLIVTFALPRDTILLILPASLLLLDESDRYQRLAMGVVAVLAALASLVKTSSAAIAVLVLAILTARAITRRRIPRHALIFAVSFIALYFASGRTLSGTSIWIRGTWHVVARWGEAWSLDEQWNILPFVLLGAAIVVIVINEARRADGHPIAFGLIGIAFLKAGSGRADAFHLLISEASIAALFVLCAPRMRWRYAGTIATAAAVIAILPNIDPGEIARQVAAAIHPLQAHRASVAFYQSEMREIRRITPLPNLRGTVDWFDARQCVVMANNLDYAPRPVFQSFMVADPVLAGINAAYLSGPEAPQWLLFEPITIDDHLPSTEDSLSWRERLTRYELAGGERTVALLRRREQPSVWRAQRLSTVRTDMGATIDVPPNGSIWVTIDVHPTLIGRLTSMISALPPVYLQIETAAGGRQQFRMIPSVARGGFLLSPVITNARAYAALAVRREDLLKPLEVRRFRVVTRHPRSFAREMTVTLDRVTF